MRRSRCRWLLRSIRIWASSGWLGCGDGMILLRVPGIVVLGCSRIRAVSRFNSAILADLAKRNIYAITSFIFGMDNDTPGVAERRFTRLRLGRQGCPF